MKFQYKHKINSKLIILFLFLSFALSATHNRAGEITYKKLSNFKYEITLVTYTYTPSAANEWRFVLPINWGDGTGSLVPRIEEINLPDDYTKNVYRAEHVFPGPGKYIISMEDPNRNEGIQNIPNSVNIPFIIKTELVINPFISYNSTPVLLNKPTDKAKVGVKFIHNPAAFDIDGDSISYKLTTCKGAGGEEIAGYTIPAGVSVNPITGNFVWDAPTKVGNYNFAMIIEEWRQGVKIGEILRDMQITVSETENLQPIIDEIHDTCVIAGDSISFELNAIDPDNDDLSISVVSGIITEIDEPRATIITNNGTGTATATLSWRTACTHIRKQPYQVVIKAKDDDSKYPLQDTKEFFIQVIAPPTEMENISTKNKAINVSWQKQKCDKAVGYKLYRKNQTSSYTHKNCEYGMPDFLNYTEIANFTDINDTSYTDTDNDLLFGENYCYRVVSIFPDDYHSIVSDEICISLKTGFPIITKVSIDSTSFLTGQIDIKWLVPPDSIDRPIKYKLFRSDDKYGNNFSNSPIFEGNEQDTTFLDENLLNTKEQIYSYKIHLISKGELIDSNSFSSSSFLDLNNEKNFVRLDINRNTPWLVSDWTIFRKNELTSSFDSIYHTNSLSFVDSTTIYENEYCYKIRTKGYYPEYPNLDSLINWTQISCITPVDTIPPCLPKLSIESNCDSLFNYLSWNFNNINDCDTSDIDKFIIYFAPDMNTQLYAIDSLEKGNYQYYHKMKNNLAGCYSIAVIDTNNNITKLSAKTCVDLCSMYELPNIFTPNGDGINDIFKPIDLPKEFIPLEAKTEIFDRWGVLVYETDDPQINWNGKYLNTNKKLGNGVYFYICTIHEQRLSGIEHRHLKGFVHLIRSKEEKKVE